MICWTFHIIDTSTATLYPQLPKPEVDHFTAAMIKEQDSSVSRVLGDDVSATLQPFTDSQIASLYHNSQLKANAEFVDAFLQVGFHWSCAATFKTPFTQSFHFT